MISKIIPFFTTKAANRISTLTGADSRLRISVISSSCAVSSISDLLVELWLVRANAIDFYPRMLDIRNMIQKDKALQIDIEKISKTDIFRYEGQADSGYKGYTEKLAIYIDSERQEAVERIKTIYGEDVPDGFFEIPAIATFFPDISSKDENKRKHAAQALVGSVKLASNIGAGVVEFVLGRRVERCDQSNKDNGVKCDFVHTSESNVLIDAAIETIHEHVFEELKETNTRLAVEIEPGFSYVLNNKNSVDYFLKCVREKGMEDYVGLNLDIGHLMILANSPIKHERILPENVWLWHDSVFHAHISDNVGYHFRDLVPGTIHDLEGSSGEAHVFETWIKLCNEIAQTNKKFSGYIALELEGCGRIQWVQRSLLRLGYLIREINSRTPDTPTLPVAVQPAPSIVGPQPNPSEKQPSSQTSKNANGRSNHSLGKRIAFAATSAFLVTAMILFIPFWPIKICFIVAAIVAILIIYRNPDTFHLRASSLLFTAAITSDLAIGAYTRFSANSDPVSGTPVQPDGGGYFNWGSTDPRLPLFLVVAGVIVYIFGELRRNRN